ncbi:winged helix-turn-helix domain-containing protein [Novosphingobium kaempferiae]|uniref:winged helix-turn-helix domain-containing protein n=1 Tax=Novosphingobium kaempferiae TaxID=2896849 RepID=UPI001E64C99E|nr:winged helix-turn-helix domain-containing protein [Novosphingobium kaempferiae]
MRDVRKYAFGPFMLIPERQMLMHGNTAVRIGCRALDLLTALVERAGEIVSKAELMARAWPTTTVDDGNLKVNMASLRKVLDDDACAAKFIATVAGRGYRFIAPVQESHCPGALETCVETVIDDLLAIGRELAVGHSGVAAPSLPSGRSPEGVTLGVLERNPVGDLAGLRSRIRFVELPAHEDRQISPWGDHQPDAVHYGIVLDGEITLLLDDTEMMLRKGCLVIQRGGAQSWVNLSGRPVRMLFFERAH